MDSVCRSVSGTSISDHLTYYGVELMGETWRSCRIVMNPALLEYSQKDEEGNFIILSRDPATTLLKLNTKSDVENNSEPLLTRTR